jgi:membrane-bound metal-dependent hydrolase YbcI (DUF457 family)
VANFKTHFVGSAMLSGALASAFLTMGALSQSQTMTAFAVGTLAGLMPDIDADNSKPLNIAFTVIAIFISFLTVFAQAGSLSIAEMVLFWLFVFFLIRFVVMRLFQSITTHRGVFHSIPVALLLSEITILLFYHFFGAPEVTAWIYGVLFFVGYMVHFILDELVSVNLFGLSVRRSLGTAMKFFDRQSPVLYLALYFLVAALFFLLPEPRKVWESFSQMEGFFHIWLPEGEWFGAFGGDQ